MIRGSFYSVIIFVLFTTVSLAAVINVPADDFYALKLAVDSSQSGDTIAVATGLFFDERECEGITILHPLVLIGNGKDSTIIMGRRQIELDVYAALWIQSNDVILKDIKFQGLLFGHSAGNPAIIIHNSSNINIQNSAAIGGDGDEDTNWGFDGGDGICILNSSNVSIDSTDVIGGNGNIDPFCDGAGGNGVFVSNSIDVMINQSDIFGGKSGDNWSVGVGREKGGNGIHAENNSAVMVKYSDIEGGRGSPDGLALFSDSTSTIDTSHVNLHTDIDGRNLVFPTSSHLYQNFPNPFNSSTKITYSIPKSCSVTITIYDIFGREIEIFFKEFQNADTYIYNFDSNNYSSGVYFYSLQVNENLIETKKMLIIK